jgi:cell fate regulator YaaT (PSP1 superfamily)
MSCSCGVDSEGAVKGCNNNGGCATGGCNKMNVFDWLSNMDMPVTDRFEIVEVRFKGGRKEFYRNNEGLDLVTGEAVIVDVPSGHHMGYVSMQGELVRLQMQKKKVANDNNIRKIYRKATIKDLEKYDSVRKREMPTLFRTRQIIQQQKLGMKLSDIEYQADNTKATFYYSADQRVDFRELIKILASEFRVRIEMKQISLRQEAGRLGGIGSCGRELCCSTWLSEFKSVATSAARYQNLSLNPSKLSGQCGRLKCCLNYELETYMDALEDIPSVNKLKTKHGDARLQKTDIFRKIMWFGFEGDNNWHPISTERVKEIMALNEKGEFPETLTEDTLELKDLSGGINSDLEKMDKKFQNKHKKKRPNKNRRKKGGNQRGGNPQNTGQKEQDSRNQKPGNKPQGNRHKGKKPNTQNQGGQTPKDATGENSKPQNSRPQNSGKNRNRNKPRNRGGNNAQGTQGGGNHRGQNRNKPNRD